MGAAGTFVADPRLMSPCNGSPRIVLSIPHPIRASVSGLVPGATQTYDALQSLFRSARRTVKIFSPYVDASFPALLRLARCPVRIVTTAREGRRLKGRPLLERCAASHRLTVRYVTEVHRDAQIFQLHAKMVLADGERAYLGSANLTDTSLNHNLEIGILLQGPGTVRSLERVFDFVFERLSVPARML